MLSSLSSWATMAGIGGTFADWLMPVLVLCCGVAVALALGGFVLRRIGSGRASVAVSPGVAGVQQSHMSAHRLGLGSGRIVPQRLSDAATRPVWDKAAEIVAERESREQVAMTPEEYFLS